MLDDHTATDFFLYNWTKSSVTNQIKDFVKVQRLCFTIIIQGNLKFKKKKRLFNPLFISSFVSFSPEKLEIGWVMRLNQVTKLLPADLFSYKLYNNSQEGDVSAEL